jgi:hypothetical protein
MIYFIIAWFLVGFLTWFYAAFLWTKKDVTIGDLLMVFPATALGIVSLLQLIHINLDMRGIYDIKVWRKS